MSYFSLYLAWSCQIHCFPSVSLTGLMAHAAGFRLTSARFHPLYLLLLWVPAQLRPVGGTQRWWGQCPWACTFPGVLLPSAHSKPGVSASILTLRSPRLWALQQRDHLQDTAPPLPGPGDQAMCSGLAISRAGRSQPPNLSFPRKCPYVYRSTVNVDLSACAP